MQEKRIKLIIKKNGGGSFKVETKGGYVGSSCEASMDDIAVMINAGTIKDQGDTDDKYRTDDPTAIVTGDY